MPLQIRDRGRHPRREIVGVRARATGAGTARTCAPSGTFAPRLGESSATAAVTPWYAFAVTITPVPPVKVRAIRSARSLASLPVQVNIAWAGPIECVASSRSA